MAWPDQNPSATDVILHLNVPCAGTGPSSPVYLEIDKLPDGGSIWRPSERCSSIREICRTGDLEGLVRQSNAMAGCRSFDDVVNAFRAMRTLG